MAPGLMHRRGGAERKAASHKQQKQGHSEGKRRLVHSSVGLLVTGLYRAGVTPNQVLNVLIWVLAAWSVIDAGRLLFPAWRPLFLRFTGVILRPHEHERLTSSFWFLVGTCLTLWFYQKRESVVLFSLLALCWSDPMASLVGRKWGGSLFRRFPNGKSVEGWLAAWAMATLIALPLTFNPLQACKCGLIAATVEVCTLPPLDDNLVVPVITGFLLTYLTNL